MYRRNRERRSYRRRRDSYDRPARGITSILRRPSTQIAFLAVVTVVIFLLLQAGNASRNTVTTTLPSDISVSEAFSKYQSGAFLLDVRTVDEWNQFHVPNTTLIPLDQLAARLNEIPRDKEIVVVCRSGNRSQQGRDILLNAGFTQVTSMTGGLEDWRASGYPTQP